MNLWKQLRGLFGGDKQPPPLPNISMQDEEPEINVPEVSVAQLQAALGSDESPLVPPLVLDVREPYEWQLVRMAIARHVPMNDVPDSLDTIPRDRPLVVVCAHGSRSYSVAAWLIEQGYDASSLAGGITQWAKQGGDVQQGPVNTLLS